MCRMVKKDILHIITLSILIIVVGVSNNVFSQTEKKEDIKPGNTSNDKKSVIEADFYDLDGALITKEEILKRVAADDSVTYQESRENGRGKVKLVKNEMIGTSSTGLTFKTLEGKTINLDKLKSKIVVLNFWYVGCKPCMTEIPFLNAVVKDYKNKKKVKFYAITFVAPKEEYPDGMNDLVSFLKKTKFDFQIAIANDEVMKAFLKTGFPQTIVLNNGTVVSYKNWLGENAEGLRKTIQRELGKR